MKKGWYQCITFVLAAAFILTTVISPLTVQASEESAAQTQQKTTEVVEESSISVEESSETSVADSNAASIPEESSDSTQNIENSEETTGGESSETSTDSTVSSEISSENSSLEENSSEEQESSSEVEQGQTSETGENSALEESRKPEAAERNMDLESISLFSNANQALLAMSSAISPLSVEANDSNMGLASGIKFYKYEIAYNKYDTNTVEYIVIHDTGNAAAGADAMAHYQYFAGGDRNASAHYFVDDGQVVQIIDDSEGSWHSGVKYKTPATPISNHNSIGIEMCINSDGDYNAAMQNTIDLAAYLLWKYDLSIDHLVRHYDANGKVCPLTMSANNWAVWQQFKASVEAKLSTYTGEYPGDNTGSTTDEWYYNDILGTSTLSADALAAALTARNTSISADYAKQVANAYLTISQYYGIRGDIAFFQAMLETNYLKYGGEVDASYYNFCGLKAPGDTESDYEYAKFNTMEEGVEAHLQHLYCYASTEPIPDGRELLDPRFGDWLRGRSTTWEGLSGIWAVPGYDTSTYSSLEDARDHHDSYGDIIVRLYADAGGTNVNTGSSSGGSSDGDSYWDNPIYTGPAAGTRAVLQKGSTGSDVKEIQGYLRTIGYSYVSVTGTFDDNTQRAVMDIQKKNDLDADGVVGEYTWAAIINTYVECVLGNSVTPPDDEQGGSGSSGSDSESSGSSSGSSGSSGSGSGSSGSGSGSSGSGSDSSGSSSGSSGSSHATVSYGSTGSDVTALQQMLNKAGYNLSVDGIFGSGTDTAVRDFQRKHGMVGDGIAGPKTWAALEKVGSGSSGSSGSSSGSGSSGSSHATVSYGSTGSDVTALQQMLNKAGYSLSVDGIFGSGTDTAVRDFQRKHGMVGDGIAGPKTWAALEKVGSGSSGSSGSSSGSGSSNSSHATVSYGSTGSDVTALQQMLNKAGYSLSVDGIFGSGTDTAVRDFQRKHGMVGDGIAGPKTWAALGTVGSGSSSSGSSSSSSNSNSNRPMVTQRSTVLM